MCQKEKLRFVIEKNRQGQGYVQYFFKISHEKWISFICCKDKILVKITKSLAQHLGLLDGFSSCYVWSAHRASVAVLVTIVIRIHFLQVNSPTLLTMLRQHQNANKAIKGIKPRNCCSQGKSSNH